LARILTEWIMKCDRVIPKTAFGFFSNSSINPFRQNLGNLPYMSNPLIRTKLIKTFPVRLWRAIRLDAVKSCFGLAVFERQDTVRGMDQSFFKKIKDLE
jgi:hypothetical protein